MLNDYNERMNAKIAATKPRDYIGYYVKGREGWQHYEKSKNKKALLVIEHDYRPMVDGLVIYECNGNFRRTWTGYDRGPGFTRWLDSLI